VYIAQYGMTEKRRNNRQVFTEKVRLSWTDNQGLFRSINVAGIDISATGMRVRSRDPLPSQIYVQLESGSKRLSGTARVRYCTPRGMDYILGLEFSGGLCWTPDS
jgi:hypothetical protein